MKIISLLKSAEAKKHNKYKLSQIKIGQLVEITINRNFRRSLKTCNDHIIIKRLDPAKTGKVVWELIYYWFLGRKKDEVIEVLFNIDLISKIY